MARRTAPAPGQYDLFGEDEAAERAAAERETAGQSARAEWQARFERADWVAPWDCAGGPSPGEPAPKKGDRLPGWVCPACKAVEPNESLLATNHGYDPDYPGWVPYRGEFGVTCVSLELRAAHRIYDERRAMLRHLAAEGLDDEQIADRIGWWNASTVAGYRKDDAAAARLAAKAAKGEVVRVGHGSECPCAFCDGPCGCPSCESFRGSR